ncbi:hypothetical protein HYT57_01505 [Candidatus Woesearchaeota archaeon]|nr:hypothetical protein [Candidatus Woesearchaeota archaeon]
MKRGYFLLIFLISILFISACQPIAKNISAERRSTSPGSSSQPVLPQEQESQLVIECAEENSLTKCNSLNPALKAAVSEQIAISTNNPQLCQSLICKQKAVFFSCLDQGKSKEECFLSSVQQSGIPQNPNFQNGNRLHIAYPSLQGVKELTIFKLENSGSSANGCNLKLEAGQPDSSVLETKISYDLGSIIKHQAGNAIYSAKEGTDSCNGLCNDLQNPLPLNMKKGCRSSNCNILDNNDLKPKADLLCGQDSKWYLCDQDGIKTFSNAKSYLCDGNTGTWEEIKQ